MANLTETAHQANNQTVLYLLNQDLQDIDKVIADKDLVQHLESTLIHWTRQIKEVVSNQQTWQNDDKTGPLEEIESKETWHHIMATRRDCALCR